MRNVFPQNLNDFFACIFTFVDFILQHLCFLYFCSAREMSHISKITASERCKQYKKGTFEVRKHLMFCCSCNVPVDFSRKSSCEKHLTSKVHQNKNSNESKIVQRGIETLFEKKTQHEQHRMEEVSKLVNAFAAANIPLHKLDNPVLKNYLESSLKDVGILPCSSNLRRLYLPKVHELHQKQVRDILFSAVGVSILTDETTDCEGRYILNVLAVPSLETQDKNDNEISLSAYFLECIALESVNFKTVSDAIIQCCNNNRIRFPRVTSFVTDNASYMTKAWERSLKGTFLNAVHVTCNAHFFNLLGEVWQKEFCEVNNLVVHVKRAFTACPSRKARFRVFLRENGKKPVLPPVPVQTRWNSWFEAVVFHAHHVQEYIDFFQMERENSSSSVLDTIVVECKDIELIGDLKEIEKYAPYISSRLTLFEKQRMCAHTIFNEMSDLSNILESKSLVCEHQKANRALSSCREKIHNYFFKSTKQRFCQPACNFFKACRVFDPEQYKFLDVTNEMNDMTVFESIPLFEDEESLKNEFRAYKGVVNELCGGGQLINFWKSKRERFPELSSAAIRCLSVPTNSVDVERSFSKYKNVLHDERRSIKESHLTMYNAIYQNAVHLT